MRASDGSPDLSLPRFPEQDLELRVGVLLEIPFSQLPSPKSRLPPPKFYLHRLATAHNPRVPCWHASKCDCLHLEFQGFDKKRNTGPTLPFPPQHPYPPGWNSSFDLMWRAPSAAHMYSQLSA